MLTPSPLPNPPSSSQSQLTPIINTSGRQRRGAFIVFEGLDRCGKSTQCTTLVQKLLSLGISTILLRFPDRTTSTGTIINEYLSSSSTTKALDDRAIHLLFSANRWESSSNIVQTLYNGTTIVCDRYVYSGVAFSASKVKPITTTNASNETTSTEQSQLQQQQQPLLDMEWCMAPDRGLPAPDCILYLNVSSHIAESRGGYGKERYETREIQERVRKQFHILQESETEIDQKKWNIINADESIDVVTEHIWSIVEPFFFNTTTATTTTNATYSNDEMNEGTSTNISRYSSSTLHQPISKVWQEGYYENNNDNSS